MDRWAACTDIKQHGPDYSMLGNKKSAKEVLISTDFCSVSKVWPWDMSAVEGKNEMSVQGDMQQCKQTPLITEPNYFRVLLVFFWRLRFTQMLAIKKTYHHFVRTTFQGCPQGYNYIPLNNNCGGFALCKYFHFKKMIQGIAAPVELSAFYLII